MRNPARCQRPRVASATKMLPGACRRAKKPSEHLEERSSTGSWDSRIDAGLAQVSALGRMGIPFIRSTAITLLNFQSQCTSGTTSSSESPGLRRLHERLSGLAYQVARQRRYARELRRRLPAARRQPNSIFGNGRSPGVRQNRSWAITRGQRCAGRRILTTTSVHRRAKLGKVLERWKPEAIGWPRSERTRRQRAAVGGFRSTVWKQRTRCRQASSSAMASGNKILGWTTSGRFNRIEPERSRTTTTRLAGRQRVRQWQPSSNITKPTSQSTR